MEVLDYGDLPSFLEEGKGLVFLLYLLWKLRPPASLGLASLFTDDFLLACPHELIDWAANAGCFCVFCGSCVSTEFTD